MKRSTSSHLLNAAETLSQRLSSLAFASPITHVYNPLEYARNNYRAYVERFAQGPKLAVFLGMNPGPWGMAQTGIPFGEVRYVTTWLNINEPVEKPPIEHPKRPILGAACKRSEVSGARLWGAIAERFIDPENFFASFFVANYCPLAFLEASGRNFTPDKLPRAEQKLVFAACDDHLREMVSALNPRFVVGVGAFSTERAHEALKEIATEDRPTVGTILHPSPANPHANAGWARKAFAQLHELGITCP